MRSDEMVKALAEALLITGEQADYFIDALQANNLALVPAETARVGEAVLRMVTTEQSVYLTPALPYDGKGWRCVVWEAGAGEDDDPLTEGDGFTLTEAIYEADAALRGPQA